MLQTFTISWTLLCIVSAAVLALHGIRKKSLSLSGAVAAFAVGTVSMVPGAYYGLMLIAFYLLGSRVTRVGAEHKCRIDGEYRLGGGGERDVWQVICNGGIGTVLALMLLLLDLNAYQRQLLTVAYASVYGSNCGDTFASELGVLSTGDPFLITSFRRVPCGTNGAVSTLRTLAAILGGSLLGISTCLINNNNNVGVLENVLVCTMSALVGTTVDSILGSLFQATYRDTKDGKIYNSPRKGAELVMNDGMVAVLSNNQVNLLSSIVTAGIVSGAWSLIQ